MYKSLKKGLVFVLIFTLIFTNLFSLGTSNVAAEGTYADDLFISEYIEGGSFNKAIEIFNGTANTVDLSEYSLELYSNGSTTVSQSTGLSGELASGEVYVLAHETAVAGILAIADTTNSFVINFNGDDAVVLRHNGEVIDVFGQVGVDPGSSWGTGDYTTIDHTLVRKSSVTSGDTNPDDVFDPSIEWVSYPKDSFDNLGTHTMDGYGSGDPIPVDGITLDKEIASVEEGKSITLTATIEPTNADNQNIIWTSEDETVATVVYGEVTGASEGSTVITATTEDGGFSDTCDITVTPVGEISTISIAEARTKAIGEIVKVKGVVTWIDRDNHYIQDSTGAIDIYRYGLASAGLEIGDMVTVTGVIAEFRGLLEITPADNADVIVESKDNPMPEPKVITVAEANSEAYESQLVKIEEVKLGTINTGGNTLITDSNGETINIYKIPELTDIVAGDLVDIIAIVSQYDSYQLRVRTDDEIVKVLDTESPIIVHTPVTEGNLAQDIRITADVTDNTNVAEVMLYYRIKGNTAYKELNMELTDSLYTAVIPKTDLSIDGIEYYIEASDGTNVVTSPADSSIPYEVSISDADILGPEIISVTPVDDTILPDTDTKPEISVEYADPSGIDTSTAKLLIDGYDVTDSATVNANSISYIPAVELSLGNHIVTLEISDTLGNATAFTWTFTIGEIEYNFYYGQLHSHTNISDGQGSLDDAYAWARDEGNADFFAVTDHSNWLDNENDTSNENITDVSQSTSDEWKLMNSTANSYNEDGEFVAIAGFEMTWSGGTGGWGHINTFNTPWFASRSNSSMDLQAYYARIATDTDSISQLNHPGTTFGDFADFGYYSQEVDDVVHLIEVGNGEGPVRGSGYFPSYEYYTRALDKGWHVAPSNNQDNHKAGWVTANEARTVVLAPELNRESIYDAIRNLRVYSTEDKNLEIMYKVNGNVMGTALDAPETLNIVIDINDPDETDSIGEVSIIANGGVEVASKTFNDNVALWELDLDPQYSYYYVRVDQGDEDIAVTAPVWTAEVTPVGISKVEVSQDPQIVNYPIDISATVYNNDAAAISNVKVEFYKNSLEGTKIGEDTIDSIASGTSEVATVEWTANETGTYNIYAKTTINIDGVDKVFTGSVSVTIANPGDVVKVVLDMGHENAYISGDYAGKDLTLREMFKERRYMLVENHDELTAEDLEGAQLLIITDPQSTDEVDYNLQKSLFTDAEVAAIKEYTDNGGALIISSKADYEDGVGEYSNGVQLNKILEAIGTNLRVNDDEVVDNTNNGGQPYRLYFDTYTSTKYNLTDNVSEGTTYSFYSGCSVILKDEGSEEAVDWLVKGHETTGTIDADYQNDNILVEQGNVNAIGAEILPSGAKIIVAGTIFFSDFETASSDNMYSNKQITENILDWMIQLEEAELKTIAEVRADENKDGVPDLMGQRFTIEGRVTAQSEAVTPKNAFFEVIYVQDETGGITVFGVSSTPLPLGTKVRVTGIVDQYDGDTELSVENETNDIVILDDTIVLVEPMIMSTGDSMLEENEGWLVKVEGMVTNMTDNSLYINDGTGEARVYVNGYIGDGTGNTDMLGKWDPSIEVGDTVSAAGLASEDPEGHRLRVRNTAEIVKIQELLYPIEVSEVKVTDIEGNEDTVFNKGDLVFVKAKISNLLPQDVSGVVIVELLDDNGKSYGLSMICENTIEGRTDREYNLAFEMTGLKRGTHTARVYVINNLTERKLLAQEDIDQFLVEFGNKQK